MRSCPAASALPQAARPDLVLVDLRRRPLTAPGCATTPPPLRLSPRVLQAIRRTIGRRPAESGGPLGVDQEGVVVRFRFDDLAYVDGAIYRPDVPSLNRLFRTAWNPRGFRLGGFVHSHPRGLIAPSEGDRIYAARLLEVLPRLERLYLPIVQTSGDGGRFALRAFVAERDPFAGACIRPCNLEIIE